MNYKIGEKYTLNAKNARCLNTAEPLPDQEVEGVYKGCEEYDGKEWDVFELTQPMEGDERVETLMLAVKIEEYPSGRIQFLKDEALFDLDRSRFRGELTMEEYRAKRAKILV